MFGLGYKWIFKSRWAALAFAAFVCWQAAEFATPGEPQGASSVARDDATMDMLKHAERNAQNLDRAIR